MYQELFELSKSVVLKHTLEMRENKENVQVYTSVPLLICEHKV